MPSTLERRNDNPERVPLRMAVELGHGDFRDPFAASVCNVSKGGISMRATCLPDVGSQLMCRFRCMPSNTLVTVHGEIVWAHLDGDSCGEFGLAFVDLDPKSEWLIEEMIAEHAAMSRDTEAAAPIATLELEGSPAPIEARMSHRGGGLAVFEQQLDLLKLGRGVRAHADGRDLLAGSISSVELKMVGAVPMLTVTVAFQHGAEVAVGGQITLPVHDTEPDLLAPEAAQASDVMHVEQELLEAETERVLSSVGELHYELHDELPQEAPARVQAPRADSHSVAFRTAASTEAEDAEFEAELEAVRAPVWKPLVMAFMQRCRVWALALSALLRPALTAAMRAATPVVRGGLLRALSRTRVLYRTQLSPQLGAMRRVLASQLSGRRRRVTAGASVGPSVGASVRASVNAQRAKAAPLGRTLVLGVLAAGAVGLAVYALVPAAGDDDVALHRKVRAAKHARDAQAATSAETAAEAALPVPEAAAKPPASDVAAGPGVATTKTSAVAPNAKSPASATTPVAAAAAGAASPEAKPAAAPRKLRFGAARVPGGRQFALRMSGPIQSIEGSADRGGFTIIVSGCLSLDRAGPIGSAHKSVSRAMVINKGDHAELSVRFSEGKQPAYQVNADGSTLYITIQDA